MHIRTTQAQTQFTKRRPTPHNNPKMKLKATTVLAMAIFVNACSSASVESQVTPVPAATGNNALSAAEKAAGWKLLFDGKSLDSWRGYKQPGVPDGWKAVDGMMAKDKPVEDIVSKEEYGDFELQIEWRIGEAGNSGIFYRGNENNEKIYWSAPEYQLLDDIKASDNKTRLTCAGAAYGLYASPEGHLKPLGEWNVTRIVAKGAHIEHWLNGFKLLEYEMWSPEWEAKLKTTKFAAWKDYGRARSGHLAIQGDHSGSLAFRGIKIRPLT